MRANVVIRTRWSPRWTRNGSCGEMARMNAFADLHRGPLPLLLPNAWDVPSALAFVAAGYPAVATTSQGVASSLGRPDATRSTREANLRLASALGRLAVPVTVDCEDGYDDDPD